MLYHHGNVTYISFQSLFIRLISWTQESRKLTHISNFMSYIPLLCSCIEICTLLTYKIMNKIVFQIPIQMSLSPNWVSDTDKNTKCDWIYYHRIEKKINKTKNIQKKTKKKNYFYYYLIFDCYDHYIIKGNKKQKI